MTRRTRRRALHAALWTGVVAGVAAVLAVVLPADVPTRQWTSLVLAYTSLGALLVTLGLGPLNVLLGRPNPVSTDVRRDAGLAAAVTGTVHTAISLTNHFGGSIATYFFTGGDVAVRSLRRDAFGVGAWTGLVAVGLVAVLAAISSDAAVRRLGRRRWKRIQRSNYALIVAAVAHTAAFWYALHRRWVVVSVALLLVVAVAALQAAGARRTIGSRPDARRSG